LEFADGLVPGPLSLDLSGCVLHRQLFLDFLIFFFELLLLQGFASQAIFVIFEDEFMQTVVFISGFLFLFMNLLLFFGKALALSFFHVVTFSV
jgi:hypothetical protein